MKSRYFAIVLVTAGLATNVEAGGMKAGLWEIKTLKQVMDGQDMQAQMAAAQAQMQQAMAGMSAAQRKQMEAMMGGQGMAMQTPGAVKVCISPEMAARDEPIVDQDGRCKPSKMSRSGNRTRFEVDCRQGDSRMVGKGESVVSADRIDSKMDMTVTDAGGRHRMQTESRMTWLGADCKGIKPMDQIAREGSARRK